MPEWTSHIRPHLAALRLEPGREAEILDEISQHLDARYEDLLRDGATESEAQRLVTEELCVPDALAEFMRPLRQSHAPLPLTPGASGTRVFRGLWQDLRIAARSLKKTPVFAAAAILYSTSRIIHDYNTDQHVAASLSLFASVALLFWYVLRILISLGSND